MDEMKTMDDLSYFVPDVKFELIEPGIEPELSA